MATMREKTKEEIDELVTNLQKIRDEIRLQLHLASMDAKKGFDQLEPELRRLEERTTHATEESANEIKEALRKLQSRFRDLCERVAH